MKQLNVAHIIDTAPELSAADIWPAPDMEALKEGRRDPPALPLSVFGPYWAGFIEAAADSASAPPDYVAAALLSVAGVLIGNARWVSPQQGWKEPPVIWSGLVGDPSSGKSPAIDPVLELVRALELEMAEGFDETHREWMTTKETANALREKWKSEVKEATKAARAAPTMPAEAVDPPEPTRPRVIVSDSTPEKLGELASAHPKGLLFFRDELSGWLGAFDRYNGNGAERALWLEANGGRSYAIDRKSNSKPIVIPHLTVAVLGGIQPDRLSELLSGPDDGLPARFMWAWPDKVKPARPTKFTNHTEARHALWRLSQLELGTDEIQQRRPIILPLDAAATDALWEWRQQHHTSSEPLSGALASAWGKAPGQLLRLALILEHVWWCVPSCQDAPPDKVSLPAIQAAAGLIEDYFKPMAARVYGDAALPERDRLASILARWIMKERPKLINARTLRRTARLPGLKEPEKVKLALSALEEADWIRRTPHRDGDTFGRQRDDYVVNPRLRRAADGK